MSKKMKGTNNIDMLTKEVGISLAIAAVVYVAGYFIVKRKSIK
jgi:hypothetical protein